jgi:hypothetical protein
MASFWALHFYIYTAKMEINCSAKPWEFHEYKFVKLAHVSFGAASSVCLLRRVINEIPHHE